MKKKILILLAASSISVTASASPYQWVRLNGVQIKKLEETCGNLRSKRKAMGAVGMIGLAGMGVYLSSLVALASGSGKPLSEFLIIAGIGGAAAGVASLPSEVALISEGFKLFSIPEQEQLIIEQQNNSPGLMTEKLYQLAEDYGFSADKALALLNLAAAEGAICGETADSKTDLTDMTGVQIKEVRGQMGQDANRPKTYDQRITEDRILEQFQK